MNVVLVLWLVVHTVFVERFVFQVVLVDLLVVFEVLKVVVVD